MLAAEMYHALKASRIPIYPPATINPCTAKRNPTSSKSKVRRNNENITNTALVSLKVTSQIERVNTVQPTSVAPTADPTSSRMPKLSAK